MPIGAGRSTPRTQKSAPPTREGERGSLCPGCAVERLPMTKGGRMFRQLRQRVARWITQPDDAEWSPTSMPMTQAEQQRIIDAAVDEYRRLDQAQRRVWGDSRAVSRLARKAEASWRRHEQVALRFGICVMPGCGRAADREVCGRHDAYR